jgi:glycosyltransferase involved in cell wall biosynthesis
MEKRKKEHFEMQDPLVAVCVPVYNGEKYIIEALESIKNQTYKNFECHIVNNASTDRTKELTGSFIKNDNRFHLHNHEEFVGLVENWNRTVDYIPENATYYKLVQADDVIFPDSLGTHVGLMERNPDAGIGSSYRLIGTNVYGSGIDYFKGNYHNGKEVLFRHLNGTAEITGSGTQLFFRMEHLKKVPGYPVIYNPEELHVDTLLAFEMFNISDLAFAFNVLSFTRRHEEAGTVTIVDKYNTYLQARESSLYRFRNEFPELAARYSSVRRRYAYFIFKSYIMNNKNTIRWHKKYLKRRFSIHEYLSGIFWENRFGARLAKRIGH